MGTFNVEIEIGDINAANWGSISALVDTGASIAAAPASVLRGLGVEPMATELFRFAAGERRRMPVGYARMRLEGKEIITQMVFNEDGTTPSLGAVALENAFLGVDPVGKRLVPVEGLMPGFTSPPR